MRVLIAPIVALCLISPPVLAEESEGKSLMERGAELFFEGLRQEMSPTLDSLRSFADDVGPSMHSFLVEMGPALAEIARDIQDWAAYHPPEMLPNGDIIIRKKPKSGEPETQEEPQAPAGPTDI